MTTQIAVKLPEEVVERIDELVATGAFASRSAAVRQGLMAILAAHERQRIDRAFADGFRRQPETDQEIDEVTRTAVAAITEEPWEKWW